MLWTWIIVVFCIGTTFGNIICEVGTRKVKNSVVCTAIVDKLSIKVKVPTDYYEANALIMSNCHVKSFDRQPFTQFRYINELDLSGNQLEKLDDDMFQNLRSLVTLNLSKNNLRQIANGEPFSNLVSLRNLDLSDNKLDLNMDLDDVLKKLMTLDLSRNIGAIPTNLKSSSLTSLSVSGITVFNVKGALQLKNLVYLDLSLARSLRFSSNDHYLNDDLQFCINLVHLNISGVALNMIYLDYNHKLEVLDASHNTLKDLPKYMFGNNQYLKDLDLSWNEIEMLDRDLFDKNQNLLRLNLEGNKIKQIGPYRFRRIHRLETLILSNNKIEQLEEKLLDNLSDLVALYLNGNQIKNIKSKQFEENQKLILLDLGGNMLTKLDPAVIKSNNLLFLYLDNNRLKTISKDIVNRENLISLFLHCNDITYVQENDIFNVPEESLLKTVTIYGNPWMCEFLNGILATKKNVDYIQSQFTDGKSVFCLSRSVPDKRTPAITHKEMYYWRVNNIGSVCKRSYLK